MSDPKSTGTYTNGPFGSTMGLRPVACGVCSGVGKVTYVVRRGREVTEQCAHCSGFGFIVLEILGDDATHD